MQIISPIVIMTSFTIGSFLDVFKYETLWIILLCASCHHYIFLLQCSLLEMTKSHIVPNDVIPTIGGPRRSI